jgi:uncharacterized protein
MTSILDAGPLVGAADSGQLAAELREALRRASRPLIIPAPVTAEVDYLLTTKYGPEAAHRFLADIAAGRFLVECLEPHEYRTVLELGARYAGLRPGLADLSVVVLAHRFETRRIITTDQRHFRAMQALDGEPFTLVPWDGR